MAASAIQNGSPIRKRSICESFDHWRTGLIFIPDLICFPRWNALNHALRRGVVHFLELFVGVPQERPHLQGSRVSAQKPANRFAHDVNAVRHVDERRQKANEQLLALDFG